MTVKSIQEAWDEVNKIFPYDYEKNETASKNAGYPIYYSTTSDHQNNWISDLGNRLEVNFEDGRSVNVWVNSEEYHHFEVTVPRLGAIMAGHKSCGMEGTFSGTAHYNQSVLRQALLDYKNTGEDVYFEMQITNDDPTSDAGRQTIIFYDCNTDGGVLAKFDADGEYLDEEIEGTFEDFSMPESFANLTGFLTN